VRPTRWNLDCADNFSPMSTQEDDPDLPATYGRRVWCFFTGPGIDVAQARYGFIGLDRYKDWVIEYPEGQTKYSGAFVSPAHLERLRKNAAQHPDADVLASLYMITGKTEHAVANARTVIERLKQPYEENDFSLCGLSHYRKSQFLAFAPRAEDALASPDLPKDLRKELRRYLALYAHVASEPDWNPRGAGLNLGTNSMATNRTPALTYFAALLPDHPCYAYWMDQIRAFVHFKFGSNTAPDGVDIDCPIYHLSSPTRTLNVSMNALRNRGIEDLGQEPYLKATLMYLANLTVPDPRFGNKRIIPGMGNSADMYDNIWAACIATFVDHDPEFAGWLQYFNRLAWPEFSFHKSPRWEDHPDNPHPLFYLPDVPERPRQLGTTILPTYGVVFRAHYGTPEETAMFFRAGSNWAHWDTDAGNVILYSKGAPLSPGTGYQYYGGVANANNAVYHNRIKLGKRNTQEIFGRVDSTIADYGFGPSADYAVANRFYPSQIFDDGLGSTNWRRHVLFLKSDKPDGANYFVMRDSFPSAPNRRKWWNWLNLGSEERVSVDDVAFAKGSAAVEKVVPEAAMPCKRGQVLEMKTDFGAQTWFWFAQSHDIRIRMLMQYDRGDRLSGRETKSIVEAAAEPDQDFFYVVYPRKDGEPAPTCQALASNIMQITTPESTDTVFVSDEPMNWDRNGITFQGKAGAVRVFKDHVTLCLNAGSGRIGYKGHVLEGHGPFERVVSLSELKPGTHKIKGGYGNKRLVVDLGRGVKITGEGPFEATLEHETLRIRTDGRDRVLFVTQPPFIQRPQYWIDGREWMACWTDYPSSGWGTYDNTWLIALSVPAGKHELVVKDYRFPPAWTRQFEPTISGASVTKQLP
jgi:hypothetical protein